MGKAFQNRIFLLQMSAMKKPEKFNGKLETIMSPSETVLAGKEFL